MIRSITFCSIWLLLLSVYYVSVGGVVALSLLALSVIVIVYSIIAVSRTAKAVHATIESVSPALKGEPAAYSIVVEGGHRLAAVTGKVLVTITHTATNYEQQHYVDVVVAQRKVVVPLQLQHDYCGQYEIAVTRIQCTDMLQLFTKSAAMESSCHVTVTPISTQPFGQVDRSLLQQEGQQQLASTQIHEEGEERAQFKLYSPGDQVKKIHWKLSSKLDELYVQQFSNLQKQELAIALDCADVQHNIKLYDHMIEKLAAVLQQALHSEYVKYIHIQQHAEEMLVTNELDMAKTIRFVLKQSIEQLSLTVAQHQQLQQQYPNIFIVTAQNCGYASIEQLVRSERV